MCPIHWAPRSTFSRSALRARLSLMRMVFCAADTAGAATRPAKTNTTRNACMESSFPLSLRPGLRRDRCWLKLHTWRGSRALMSPAARRWSSGVGPRSLHDAHRGQPIDRGPVAELAGAVLAPAIGGARGRDPASVVLIGAHRGEGHAARHEYRARPASRGPVAELAVAVVAPAIGGARGCDATGVDAAAGAHRREGHAAHHEYRARPASRGPVAELAEAVVAPAIGAARGREPAGVVLAGGAHRCEAHAARHEPRGRPASRGLVAELAVAVVAPA